MPDISGSAQAINDVISSHTSGWAEAAAAFVGGVIWFLLRKATQAGDEDRGKPSSSSIGGTGVAFLADGNPIRELTTEVKGMRADFAAARGEDAARRAAAEKRHLEDENEDLKAQVARLETGQRKTHGNQDAILEALRDLLADPETRQRVERLRETRRGRPAEE